MQAYYILLAVLLMLDLFSADISNAAKESDSLFSFVVLGHLLGPREGGMNPHFNELLAEVRELNPDLVFLTGDLICDFINNELPNEATVTGQWDRLDAELAQLSVPIYRVPGNHDVTYPIARDIYFDRYGKLPQAVSYRGSLFILLNSAAVPEGDKPAPYLYSRGKPLDSRQIDFILEKLSKDQPYNHVFLFMHHLLWWSEDDPWWRDVHPLLVNRNVRAVFGGDHGPMKFSHMKRDEINYLQSGIEQISAIENPRALNYLRTREGDRLVAQQFDNFLYVTVDGPQVNIEVKTVGAMSSGKFSPQRFRDIHQGVEPATERPLVECVWNIIGSKRRLVALALVTGICFLSGLPVGLVLNRRKLFHRKIASNDSRT